MSRIPFIAAVVCCLGFAQTSFASDPPLQFNRSLKHKSASPLALITTEPSQIDRLFLQPFPNDTQYGALSFSGRVVETASGRFIFTPSALLVYQRGRLVSRILSSTPEVFSSLQATTPNTLENRFLRIRIDPDAVAILQTKSEIKFEAEMGPFEDTDFAVGSFLGLSQGRGFYIQPSWQFSSAAFQQFRGLAATFNPVHSGFDYNDLEIQRMGLKNWTVSVNGGMAGYWKVKYAVAPHQPLVFGLPYSQQYDPNKRYKQFVHSVPIRTCSDTTGDADSDGIIRRKIEEFKNRAAQNISLTPTVPSDINLVAMINWSGNYRKTVDGFIGPYELCDSVRMSRVIEIAHENGVKIIYYTGVGFLESLPTDARIAQHLVEHVNTTTPPADGLYIDGFGVGNNIKPRLVMLMLRNSPRFGSSKFIISHTSQGVFDTKRELRLPWDNLSDYGLGYESRLEMTSSLLRLNHPSHIPYDLLVEGPRNNGVSEIGVEAQSPLGLASGFRFRVNKEYKFRENGGRYTFTTTPVDLFLNDWRGLLNVIKEPESIRSAFPVKRNSNRIQMIFAEGPAWVLETDPSAAGVRTQYVVALGSGGKMNSEGAYLRTKSRSNDSTGKPLSEEIFDMDGNRSSLKYFFYTPQGNLSRISTRIYRESILREFLVVDLPTGSQRSRVRRWLYDATGNVTQLQRD